MFEHDATAQEDRTVPRPTSGQHTYLVPMTFDFDAGTWLDYAEESGVIDANECLRSHVAEINDTILNPAGWEMTLNHADEFRNKLVGIRIARLPEH